MNEPRDVIDRDRNTCCLGWRHYSATHHQSDADILASWVNCSGMENGIANQDSNTRRQ